MQVIHKHFTLQSLGGLLCIWDVSEGKFLLTGLFYFGVYLRALSSFCVHVLGKQRGKKFVTFAVYKKNTMCEHWNAYVFAILSN